MDNRVEQLLNPSIYSDIVSITKGDTDFGCFKNKSVMITGAGQLLGYYIACAFLVSNDIYNTNTRLIAVDRDNALFKRYGKLTYRDDIDLRVSENYSDIRAGADYVIHTERFSGEATEEAVCNLLEYIKNSEATAVINSYADIYGEVFNGSIFITEEDMGYIDCAKRESACAQAQRTALSFAKKYASDNSLDIKLAVCSSIYGAREFDGDSSYVNLFLNAVLKHNLLVTQKDSEIKSLCYVTDAACALLKILTRGKSGELYNVSSGISASVKQVAEKCVKLFSDSDIKVIYKYNSKSSPLSPMAPTRQILNNSKLLSLGFTPKVSLDAGVARAVQIISEEK